MKLSRDYFKSSARARLLTAVLSGALVGFSLPPWGWWPLAVIGVAILFAICNLTEKS